MTCAHVVDVALKKVPGVESVEVSLNKGLATVKLKPGNEVSVSQLWQLLHQKGYTPQSTAVSVRGEVMNPQGRIQLKVSGAKEILALVADPKNPATYNVVAKKLGQTVLIQGVMAPGKNLKAPVPLQVRQVKEEK
ncbi:MAG: heavy-metal-associated domain-containing protein [Acidobacteriota bacterium]|nr:heavy-metal-associated domain-containing protein [Acidobacteriota bacterium]